MTGKKKREEQSATRLEMVATGKARREEVPLESLADLDPGVDRDVVGLVLGQGENRVPELVPVRHTRMASSAFASSLAAPLSAVAEATCLPSAFCSARVRSNSAREPHAPVQAVHATSLLDVSAQTRVSFEAGV